MFITLEGMEGSGKSTVISGLQEWLTSQGKRVQLTREPGGSRLGKTLRSILLDAGNDDITGEAELFLYLADRAQHMSSVIQPALEAGVTVISDRFADSTVVYQGYGRGLDPEILHQFNEVAVNGVWPDVTLLLDLDPNVGLQRALVRNSAEGLSVSEGRFEAESLAFHTRVREGYLAWAKRHAARFVVVNADQSPEGVYAEARQAIARRMGLE